ncbi:aldehyde dehydrogenase (NAD+) [Panacagrimonas perspica]|uniref:Aldehyde dehydrogenase (NAD+) n=1 Tax=Panacagrimonas perspica TaxID=381431 RepID=A0A4V3F5Y5_9GAMM|nr:aldehyde dehydrogenase family protein [Panacagrimonas perspica]TDU30756.1 aldehyde dehydrogenase (NAD+) [Panacagrimonas perspica]THD01574.1 aldehyde dehydrogenase family protein [Panacagrimonas perspica]
MEHTEDFYIDGAWVRSASNKTHDVIDPSTEKVIATIRMGTAEDVDRAVKAARKAFETFSQTTREERVALLQSILKVYKQRIPDVAKAISSEMGAPIDLANGAQAPSGLGHLYAAIAVLKEYPFEELRGTTMITRESFGVCGFITPWNWPINQIMCKVAPAIAAGCTCVLKPSEIAPLNAILFAEILHEAGVPKGVFNLVHGDGPTVGEALVSHPEVDLVSFTGSTRAGVQVAKRAADTVKRVAQELGGKSANLILDDADIERSVKSGTLHMMQNSGQSCNAPSRMFVPRAHYEKAVEVAKKTAESVKVGPASETGIAMGPLSSKLQFERVQGFIEKGVAEGARVVTGGPGRPEGLDKGYFARPTVFADVRPDMTISREEIFGPVLCMLPYDTEEEAIAMANDTQYGLSGYVSSKDLQRARRVASKLRTGMVHINGAALDPSAPFGGYKQSGNGREWGEAGFEEFLEIKAVMGYQPAEKKA